MLKKFFGLCQNGSQWWWPFGWGQNQSLGDILKDMKKVGISIDMPDIKDDENGFNGLHWACFKGHIEVVEILLNHEANIEATTIGKSTPLILASEKGHFAIGM